MIQIDYDTLGRLLQLKGISRRKLALSIGIDEGRLAAAFRRHSKMKTEVICSIAAALEIEPSNLLLKDENGNIKNAADAEAICADRRWFDSAVKDFTIQWINDYLVKLNDEGLEEVRRFAEIVSENPRFLKHGEEG